MIKDLKVNKKLFFTTILLASSLLAKNIEFEEMEKNPQRVNPNQPNQILSFGNSIKSSVSSIVNISAKRSVNPNVDTLPLQMFDDPFFKKFFGEEFSNQFKQNRVQRAGNIKRLEDVKKYIYAGADKTILDIEDEAQRLLLKEASER